MTHRYDSFPDKAGNVETVWGSADGPVQVEPGRLQTHAALVSVQRERLGKCLPQIYSMHGRTAHLQTTSLGKSEEPFHA